MVSEGLILCQTWPQSCSLCPDGACAQYGSVPWPVCSCLRAVSAQTTSSQRVMLPVCALFEKEEERSASGTRVLWVSECGAEPGTCSVGDRTHARQWQPGPGRGGPARAGERLQRSSGPEFTCSSATHQQFEDTDVTCLGLSPHTCSGECLPQHCGQRSAQLELSQRLSWPPFRVTQHRPPPPLREGWTAVPACGVAGADGGGFPASLAQFWYVVSATTAFCHVSFVLFQLNFSNS